MMIRSINRGRASEMIQRWRKPLKTVSNLSESNDQMAFERDLEIAELLESMEDDAIAKSERIEQLEEQMDDLRLIIDEMKPSIREDKIAREIHDQLGKIDKALKDISDQTAKNAYEVRKMGKW